MVLPMPLEMLGCPARLFLDQWQRVNGCRCIPKKRSEIPTDPGKSFLIILHLLACLICYLSHNVPFLLGSCASTCFSIISSSTHLSSNHSLLLFCAFTVCLTPTFLFFLPPLLANHLFLSTTSFPALNQHLAFLLASPLYSISALQIIYLPPLLSFWTTFLQLVKFVFFHTTLKHINGLLWFHTAYIMKLLSEGVKWKVILCSKQGFYYYQIYYMMSCIWSILPFCIGQITSLSNVFSMTFYLYGSSSCSLVKSLLFSCVGGYKYLYTGNLSRQVRRSC